MGYSPRMISIARAAIAFSMLSGPVLAQGLSPGAFNPVGSKPPSARTAVVPPPAVPGSRAEPSAVAPASPTSLDMPPTEALFDAINRGDMVVAKDAVSRGADIQGRNILGLTPIELAVDLGRNDISFMLLSLRGDSGARRPAAAEPSKAENAAATRAERNQRNKAAAAAPPLPAAPQTARLFAGNGGQPIPQAGFLGFDARR